MKALVIGGTGPTGPHIVQGLVDRGYEPVILNRGNHPIPELDPYEHIRADPHFEEPMVEAMEGRSFDLIVATYGRLRILVEVLRGISDRLITVGGTVYAKAEFSRPADETAARSPGHKLVQRIVQTEEALQQAHDDGHFSLTHLRYPNLYGPRQLAPREWSIIRRLQDGRRGIPVMDGGLTLESRAFVVNAAQAVLLAIDKPEASAGRFYNVADELTPSDGERALAIAEAMNINAHLVNYPKEAARPAHFWGVGRNLEYMGSGEPPPTHHKLLDISRIQSELGYRDIVGFPEAIKETVAWYVDNPLERGGKEEGRIGDPFDYEGEDRFEAKLKEFQEAMSSVDFSDVEMRHSYDHPKKPQDDKQE